MIATGAVTATFTVWPLYWCGLLPSYAEQWYKSRNLQKIRTFEFVRANVRLGFERVLESSVNQERQLKVLRLNRAAQNWADASLPVYAFI